jgi:hypothetical protein
LLAHKRAIQAGLAEPQIQPFPQIQAILRPNDSNRAGRKLGSLLYLSIVSPPTKTVYFKGEEMDLTGLSIKGHYQLGDQAIPTDSLTVSGFSTDTPGECEVTLTYKEKTKLLAFSIGLRIDASELATYTGATYKVYDIIVDGQMTNITGSTTLTDDWKALTDKFYMVKNSS